MTLCVIFSSARAAAAEQFAGLPFFETFPTTTGIIYPSILTAAGVNAAALPQRQKKTSAFGVDYSPAPGGDGAHNWGMSVASADSRLGFAAGYKGSIVNSVTNQLFAGAGFRAESTSLGLGLRSTDLAKGLRPETDLGILASTKGDVTFGLVLYRLESTPQLDFGIGFGKDKSYNFEVNLLLPPVGLVGRADANYIITAATTVYAGIFGLSFNSSYSTLSSEVAQSVSLLIWFHKNLAFTVQYRSPNRSYYGVIIPF